MNPFPPELRTMSVVARWSVVFTLTRDTVANHSLFVAIYADAIAELIGWKGNRGDLLYYALVHDAEEVCTGDLVSPSKRAIIDPEKYAKYVGEQLTKKMPSVMERLAAIENDQYGFDEIQRIVSAADRLDALLFLIVERRMGNQHMEGRADDALERFEDAWEKLPLVPNNVPPQPDLRAGRNQKDFELYYLWNFVVLPAIDEHRRIGGSGV